MIITLDIGNTNVKVGLYEETDLYAFDYFPTKQGNPAEKLQEFLDNHHVQQAEGAMISCVVPSVKEALFEVLSKVCTNIHEVSYKDRLGIQIDIPHPEHIGEDLLAMNAYAYHLAQEAVLTVSLGTAGVFCYTDDEGTYRYATIAPGFEGYARSLWENASLLPDIDLHVPEHFLADNTVDAMNVGIVEGYIGLCRHMIQRFKEETGKPNLKVIACGGNGKLLVERIPEITYYEPDLISHALIYLYLRRKHS